MNYKEIKQQISETIVEFTQVTSFQMRALITLVRSICETIPDIKGEISKTHWGVIHALIHGGEKMEVKQQGVIKTLLHIIGIIEGKTDLDFGNIKNILSSNFENDYQGNFWNLEILTSGKITKKKVIVTGIKLINPLKPIYLIYCETPNSELYFWSPKKLQKGKSYEVELQLHLYNHGEDRVFVLKKHRSLTEEYITGLLQGMELNYTIEEIVKFINTKNDKIFDVIKEICFVKEEVMREVKYFQSNTRKIPHWLTLLTVEKRTQFISQSFYPWSNDPIIASLPANTVQLNFIWKKKLWEYLRKEKLINDHAWEEYENKLAIDDKGSLIMSCDSEEEKSPIVSNGAKHSIRYLNGYKTTKEYASLLQNMHAIFEENKRNAGSNLQIKDKALGMLNSRKSIVICGPAGHGKSYAIKKILLDNPGKKTFIFTPTWKATTVYDNVDKEQCTIKTVQSVFNSKNTTDKEQIIQKIKDEEEKLIIFDEISMYSDEFWNEILDLVKRTPHQFIFMGDYFQIPPIHSNERATTFFKVARKYGAAIDFSKKENYRLKTSKHADKLIPVLKEIRKNKFDINRLAKTFIKSYSNYEELFSFINEILAESKIPDVTFITRNNKGIDGSANLNRKFLKRQESESDFKEGDRVIFKKTVSEIKCYNNDETTLKKIEVVGDRLKYAFSNRFGEDKTFTCYPSDEPFEHSLFLTAHKMQGNSNKKIVVIVSNDFEDIRWLYTACSRTSDELVVLMPNSFEKFQGFKMEDIEFDYKTSLK